MNLIKEFLQQRKLKVPQNVASHSEDDMCIMGNLKNVQLTMYDNEPADKPHIHFINLKTGEEGALSLQKAEYYDHGNYNGRLSNELLKEIYDYCVSPCSVAPSAKTFEFICSIWETFYDVREMDEITPRYDLMGDL